MTPADFDKQVQRMESQWPRTYGQERKALLWQAMKDVHPDDFLSAVDSCLASHRAPPLLEQLSTEVDQAKTRRISNEARRGVGGFYETLDTAARNNKSADPEFVQACLKLLSDYGLGKAGPAAKKLSREQFDEGCGYLADVARRLNTPQKTTTVAVGPRRSHYSPGEDND
jgi:hypothetical protein